MSDNEEAEAQYEEQKNYQNFTDGDNQGSDIKDNL